MYHKKIILIILCTPFYALTDNYELLEKCPIINTLNVAGHIQSAAFDASEQQCATRCYKEAKTWRIKGRTFTERTNTFKTESLSFSDVNFVSNELLLTADYDGNAVLRNLTTQAHETFNHPQNEVPPRLPNEAPLGLPCVYSARANPDKTGIVTATKGYAAIWDIKTGERTYKLKHDAQTVIAALFNSDGSQVATAAENFIHLWDAKNGDHIASLENENTVTSISFCPDRTSIIAAVENLAKVWSVGEQRVMDTIEVDEREEQDLQFDKNVTKVEYHPDGRHLLTSSFNRTIPCYQDSELRPRGIFHPKVKLWNTKTKECLHTLENKYYPDYHQYAQFTHSGEHIAAWRKTWRTTIDVHDISRIIQ